MDRLTQKIQAGMDAAGARFASPLRSKRLTVVLGRWLGLAFTVCFATGLYSHFLQQPLPWMLFLPRPVWLYQLTQGVHVATGTAAIPLLLFKLWSVYPQLLGWPPIRSVLHALERATIAMLVAASLVELTTGLINTFDWYPWPFPFRTVHYWLSWVIVSSLALHIAVKLPIIREHWSRKPAAVGSGPELQAQLETGAETVTLPAGAPEHAVSRRALLATVGITSAVAVGATAGQSFRWLSAVNLFAPRQQDTGPAGVPVNRTAAQAGVSGTARAPGWTVTLTYQGRQRSLTLAQLRAMPQSTSRLPVACVDGWSQDAVWRGVKIVDLMTLMGAPANSDALVHSLEQAGAYGRSLLPAAYSQDPLTLLALELNGAPLDLDHGYPARIMAPGRPGVLQTKWVNRIQVLG